MDVKFTILYSGIATVDVLVNIFPFFYACLWIVIYLGSWTDLFSILCMHFGIAIHQDRRGLVAVTHKLWLLVVFYSKCIFHPYAKTSLKFLVEASLLRNSFKCWPSISVVWSFWNIRFPESMWREKRELHIQKGVIFFFSSWYFLEEQLTYMLC